MADLDHVDPYELAAAWGHQVAVVDGTNPGIRLERVIWVDAGASEYERERQIMTVFAYCGLEHAGIEATDEALEQVIGFLLEPPRMGPIRSFDAVLRGLAERERERESRAAP
jgi:hypothetical protein